MKLPTSLGWTYPSRSPFVGRMVVRTPTIESKPVAPPAPTPELRMKRQRDLAWLAGGEERVGFSILGRRIEPQCDALRPPRMKSPAKPFATID